MVNKRETIGANVLISFEASTFDFITKQKRLENFSKFTRDNPNAYLFGYNSPRNILSFEHSFGYVEGGSGGKAPTFEITFIDPDVEFENKIAKFSKIHKLYEDWVKNNSEILDKLNSVQNKESLNINDIRELNLGDWFNQEFENTLPENSLEDHVITRYKKLGPDALLDQYPDNENYKYYNEHDNHQVKSYNKWPPGVDAQGINVPTAGWTLALSPPAKLKWNEYQIKLSGPEEYDVWFNKFTADGPDNHQNPYKYTDLQKAQTFDTKEDAEDAFAQASESGSAYRAGFAYKDTYVEGDEAKEIEEKISNTIKDKIKEFIKKLEEPTAPLTFYVAYGMGPDFSSWAGPYICTLMEANNQYDAKGVRHLSITLVASLSTFGEDQRDNFLGGQILKSTKSTIELKENDLLALGIDKPENSDTPFAIPKNSDTFITHPEKNDRYSEFFGDIHIMITTLLTDYVERVTGKEAIVLFPNLENVLISLRREAYADVLSLPTDRPNPNYTINKHRIGYAFLLRFMENLGFQVTSQLHSNFGDDLHSIINVEDGKTLESALQNVAIHLYDKYEQSPEDLVNLIFYNIKEHSEGTFTPTIIWEQDVSILRKLNHNKIIENKNEPVIILGDRNIINSIIYGEDSLNQEIKSKNSAYALLHPINKNDSTINPKGSNYLELAKENRKGNTFRKPTPSPAIAIRPIPKKYIKDIYKHINSEAFGAFTPMFKIEEKLGESPNLEIQEIIKRGTPIFKSGYKNSNILSMRMDIKPYFLASLFFRAGPPLYDPSPASKLVPQNLSAISIENEMTEEQFNAMTKEADIFDVLNDIFAKSKDFIGFSIDSLNDKKAFLAYLIKSLNSGEGPNVDMKSVHAIGNMLEMVSNQAIQGSIRTLPYFQLSGIKLLGKLVALKVREARVSQNIREDLLRNTSAFTDKVYSGYWNIFGFKHIITNKEAYSEFTILKNIDSAVEDFAEEESEGDINAGEPIPLSE